MRLVLAGLALLTSLLMPACADGRGPTPIVPVDPPPDAPPGGQPPPPPAPQPPDPPDPPPADDLAGGVLATFKVEAIGPDLKPFTETFSVWVTNGQTIEDLFEMEAGVGANRIVAGPILEGPGQGDHNAPYSWHLDPEEVQVVDAAMEVCDSRPSIVEANLEAFLAIGLFCPWAAKLDTIADYR